MIPIPVRLAVIGTGALIFFGSWLVGNTVDAVRPPDAAERTAMLQKDALTFFMRIIGAVLVLGGLLLWVVANLGRAPAA